MGSMLGLGYNATAPLEALQGHLKLGDVEAIELILRTQPISLKPLEELPIMHEAASRGHLTLIKYLIEKHGFNPNLLHDNSSVIQIARKFEQKKIVKYLARQINKQNLGPIIENMNDAAVLGDSEATILGFNLAAEKLFGYKKSDVIGKNVKDVLIYDEEIRNCHPQYVQEHFTLGRKNLIGTQRVVSALHKNGKKIQVSISLAAVASGNFLATFRLKENSIKEVISSMKDAVLLTQKNGRITAVNRPAELLFGYKEHELLNHLPSTLIWDENLQQAHAKFMMDYERSGIQKFIGVRRAVNVKRKDGTRLQVEILLSELEDKSFLASFRQIRPREQVEKELLWSLELPQESSNESISDSDSSVQYLMHSSISRFAIPTINAGDIVGLKRLLSNNLDVNSRDYNGDTLLHHAAAAGNMDIIKLLLEQPNIQPELVNNWNQTPTDIAKKKGHQLVAQFLVEINDDRYISRIDSKPLSTKAPEAMICKMGVSSSELIYEEELGRGRFGIVYKGKWRYVPVAIKNVKIIEQDYVNDLLHEATVMLELRPHPNVVSLLGVCADKNNYAIITEYLDGGSLESYLKGNKELNLSTIVKILLDAAMGIVHLHTEGVVHRDVASRNVLLSGSPVHAKIADFGFAKVIEKYGNSSVEAFGGAVRWMPPEAIRYNTFSKYSDAWSFGILCYECFAREDPFPTLSLSQLIIDIGNNYATPVLPPNVPPFLKSLIQNCWQREPTERPTFHDIVEVLSKNIYKMNEDTFNFV